MTKLSLILMCWNTAHLLERTLFTLEQQTLDDWELIVIDDKSDDDVPAALDRHSRLPIRYYRLEHAMGMRGNTVSLNYGIRKARGFAVMWSTPEVMLPPTALQAAYDTTLHDYSKPMFVTVPSHGLSAGVQLKMDTVDWKTDVHCIKDLVKALPEDDWDSKWFYLNFNENGVRSLPRKKSFGHNQTVAVRRNDWISRIGHFPYFLDYGSDDPWVGDKRKKTGYEDITLWDQEAYHQWHTNVQYWMALDKAPYWNKWGHTIDNLLGDPEVPPGGTCEIWDGGKRDKQTTEDKKDALNQRGLVEATGFRKAR
jgi:glycosyltransferase involved in cell wall biosynthesis